MSKTSYIQEVLSTRDSDEEIIEVADIASGVWRVRTSRALWLVVQSNDSKYLCDHMQLDPATRWESEVDLNNGEFFTWLELKKFLEGELSSRMSEITEQQLSESWRDFKSLRALNIFYYTPNGVVAEGVDASCATPWDRFDFTSELAMPEPDVNSVAFFGYGQLGWPRAFLRKLFAHETRGTIRS